MFDISWGKLMLIGVVALIVIGPKELPGVLRMVGVWVGKVRRMAAEFQSQFQEAMREAEMADLKKHVDELNDATRSLNAPFDPLNAPKESETHGTGGVSTSAPSTAVATGADADPPQPQSNGAQSSSPDVSVPAPEAPTVIESDLAPPATPEAEGRRA